MECTRGELSGAGVQAIFDAVRPGSTVQFAPGTYLLGAGARLTVPDVPDRSRAMPPYSPPQELT